MGTASTVDLSKFSEERCTTEVLRGPRGFPLMATDDTAYWLVYPEARKNVRKIRAFREWILGELQQQAT